MKKILLITLLSISSINFAMNNEIITFPSKNALCDQLRNQININNEDNFDNDVPDIIIENTDLIDRLANQQKTLDQVAIIANEAACKYFQGETEYARKEQKEITDKFLKALGCIKEDRT